MLGRFLHKIASNSLVGRVRRLLCFRIGCLKSPGACSILWNFFEACACLCSLSHDLTVKELIDFQHTVETHEQWAPERQGVLPALRSALESKLSGGLERKRKYSLVDAGPEEQSNLKMMRAARSIFAQGAAAGTA